MQKKNWAKDKAKLDYMATAKGRTTNPQYWTGLILIGDTSPIALQNSNDFVCWVLILIAIAIVVALMRWKLKKKFFK